MATSSQLLGFITYFLIQSTFVSSSPGSGLLSARQSGCDSLVCVPSLGDVIGGAEDFLGGALGVGAGLAGYIIDKTTGLLVPQPVESNPSKKPDDGKDPVPNPMYLPDPVDIEQDLCTAPTDPNPDDGTGQISVNAQPCGPATMQIVWASNCDNTAQNSAFETTLKGMDNDAFSVRKLSCKTKDGVWFWVGTFTPEQIETIKKAVNVVKAVERDVLLESDFRSGPTASNRDPVQFQQDLTAAPSVEEFSLEKRAEPGIQSVIRQKKANPSLSFLSTPVGKQLSGVYAFFRPRYFTMVYLLEFGLNENHPEISKIVDLFDFTDEHSSERRFKEKDWWKRRPSTPEEIFRGTCLASIVNSKKNGVARGLGDGFSAKRRNRVVKIRNHLWSLLDGLQFLDLATTRNTYLIDYRVAVIPFGWNVSEGNISLEDALAEVELLIERMINKQVIFVVAAGGPEHPTKVTARRNYYPAHLAERLPIIVVGAVDVFTGEKPPWALDPPYVTVSGPAQGYCLDQEAIGTSVASAYVGGLVAYFSALPDVGAYLRAQPSLPLAMIDYLQRLAYPRSQDPSHSAQRAVWNGLDASKPGKKYSFWIGDPAQDREVPKTSPTP